LFQIVFETHTAMQLSWRNSKSETRSLHIVGKMRDSTTLIVWW